MSSEENKANFRMLIEEVFNKGNFDILDDLFSPDYVEHQFGLKPSIVGMKEDFGYLRQAFPDLKLTIEHLTADEDLVWGHMTARGTNLGSFMGAPTGKAMEITVIDIVRFRDGQIIDHWGVPDRFALLAQLGLLPRPNQAGNR